MIAIDEGVCMEALHHRRKVAAFLFEPEAAILFNGLEWGSLRRVAARLIRSEVASDEELLAAMHRDRHAVSRILSHTSGNPLLWTELGRATVAAYVAGQPMPEPMTSDELLGELGGVKVERLLGPRSDDPTPEQIASQCLLIQDGWRPGEHATRRRGGKDMAKRLTEELRDSHEA